jgi:hypothetical protein
MSSSVTLVSNNGDSFVISPEAVKLMLTIDNMIDDLGESDEPVPLYTINTETLKRVIEYTDKYLADPFVPASPPSEDSLLPPKPREFLPWELEFFNGPWSSVKDVMMAANLLDYQVLLQSCAQYIASQIMKMTPEEVKEYCSS